MATFPLLKTGAVAQYPFETTSGQGSQVLRFIDGTDQRWLTHGSTLRAWRIQLDLLDEDEISSLEAFFRGQLGGYSKFTFPDPYSGTNVPACRFAEDSLVTDYADTDHCAVAFWVIETYG
jgi:hypothetical protein